MITEEELYKAYVTKIPYNEYIRMLQTYLHQNKVYEMLYDKNQHNGYKESITVGRFTFWFIYNWSFQRYTLYSVIYDNDEGH